ncbi:bifunctional dethiobiotin synthetase/78-diamino-pelargonic acid mitochondrial-like, partial [Trifolium medium]|nr:bifunctional dethiobiotin synthetase/78-diamino-pelargonic acid mitochondrial-like [Trifolium medium]
SSLLSPPSSVIFHYLKPLQTGFPSDSDSRFVFNKLLQLRNRNNNNTRISLSASNRVLNVSPASINQVKGIDRFVSEEGSDSSELICKTLYAWEEAVSPHLAAEREGFVVKDSAVLEMLQKCFSEVSESGVDKERSEVL